MESFRLNMNVSRMDPVAVFKLLNPLTEHKKTISVNGINQLKIECESWVLANGLVESGNLLMEGFKLLITESFLGKKGFTKLFPTTRYIGDIIPLIKKHILRNIISIRSIFDNNNKIT